MLALLDYEAQLCTGCGGFLPDTADPESHSFHAEDPHRCYRCNVVQNKQKEYQKDTRNPEALRVWPVTVKPKKKS